MGEFCNTERDGHLLIVTINRPERMNALHPPGNHEMAAVFDEFQSDPDLWVAIVTGAGERAFCAGNDLRFQVEHGRKPQPATHFGGLTARFDLDKPVIAAVNGVAMGGGFEIALACDILVAAENAVFALPEPRVGLAALAGGLHRLSRQIPMKRAMGMILTGRRVTAAEGYQLGFVTEVVPEGEALAESTGEPRHAVVGAFLEPGERQRVVHAASELRHAIEASEERQVLPGRQVAVEEQVVTEYADASAKLVAPCGRAVQRMAHADAHQPVRLGAGTSGALYF